MKLTHTTLMRNLPSIRKFGLLKTFARQGRVAVWLHVSRLDQWAEAHVRVRHGAEREELVHIVVDVPRKWVKRHCNGVYYCCQDIPPDRFRRLSAVRTIEVEIAL